MAGSTTSTGSPLPTLTTTTDYLRNTTSPTTTSPTTTSPTTTSPTSETPTTALETTTDGTTTLPGPTTVQLTQQDVSSSTLRTDNGFRVATSVLAVFLCVAVIAILVLAYLLWR